MPGEKNVSQQAYAFLEFARDLAKGNAANLAEKLEEFAPLLSNEKFKSAVEIILMVEAKHPAAPAQIVPDTELRIPPPRWKVPNKADRKKGKKEWTAKIRDFDLRVEYRKTKAEGVMFHGYINDRHEGVDKLNSSMQLRLYNEVLRRIRQGG